MELIVISSPTAIAEENSIIDHLFRLGLKCFHIRKPKDGERQLRKLIEGLNPLYYTGISLHQHHQLAKEYGIKRLHFTEKARTLSTAKDLQILKEQGYTLSSSVHDISVLPSLKIFDYVFFGPVFDSLSKPGYRSNLTENFKLNKDLMTPKVIALGGVEVSQLPSIKSMCFDGAAVLGSIWERPENALMNFSKLKEHMLPNC